MYLLFEVVAAVLICACALIYLGLIGLWRLACWAWYWTAFRMEERAVARRRKERR